MRDLTIEEMEDRLSALYEAQGMLDDVVRMVREVIRGLPCEGWADAYVLAPLVILANPNHGYLTRDPGLHDLVETIQREMDEAREREQEEDELEAEIA